MRPTGLLLALALVACGGSGGDPDAPTSGICVSRGGLKILLRFDAPGPGDLPGWTDPEPLHVTLAGSGTNAYQITPDQVNADHEVVVLLDFPRGTIDGDGVVAFYGSSDGAARWQAYPQTFSYITAGIFCAEIGVAVQFVGSAGP
jgi:hypothetical protein